MPRRSPWPATACWSAAVAGSSRSRARGARHRSAISPATHPTSWSAGWWPAPTVTAGCGPRSGPEINVPLPRSINQAGAALFRGDGATLTLALSPALGESGDEVECDLVDARTGQRHTLGPDGITPVSWLPDGRLLAVRRPGVAGGEVGTYLVAPAGSALRAAQSAEAIALLHGP